MSQRQVRAMGCKGGVLSLPPVGWAFLCLYHPSCIQAKGCASSSSWCFPKEAGGEPGMCIDSVKSWEAPKCSQSPLLGGNQVMYQCKCERQLWLIKEERKWMEMGKKESILESWRHPYGQQIHGSFQLAICYFKKGKFLALVHGFTLPCKACVGLQPQRRKSTRLQETRMADRTLIRSFIKQLFAGRSIS